MSKFCFSGRCPTCRAFRPRLRRWSYWLVIGVAMSCAPDVHAQFSESFESIGGLLAKGWKLQNNSYPANSLWPTWFRGDAPILNPLARPRLGDAFADMDGGGNYLAANFRTTNGSGLGTISLWAITPPLDLRGGETVRFWTRSAGNAPDRLQVRMSNGSDDCGTALEDVGAFTLVLADLNPDYLAGGYPTEWTRFQIRVPQIQLRRPRLAFRYFVQLAGEFGPNGDYIGIDSLKVSP